MKWLLNKIECAIGEDDSRFQILFDEYRAKGGNLHAPGTNGLTILTRLAYHGKERLEQLNYVLSKMTEEDILTEDGNKDDVLAIAQRLNHTELFSKLAEMLIEDKPRALFFSKISLESLEKAIDKNNVSDFVKLLDQYLTQGGNINQVGSDGFTLLTRLVNAKTDSFLALNHLLSKMHIKDIAKPDGEGRMAIRLANLLPTPIKEQRVQLLDSKILMETLIGGLKGKGGKASVRVM